MSESLPPAAVAASLCFTACLGGAILSGRGDCRGALNIEFGATFVMGSERISRTALGISKGLLFHGQKPEIGALAPHGAVDCTERLLLAAGLLGPRELSLIRANWLHRIIESLQRFTVPGGGIQIAIRKRFFEEETRAAINQGAVQVLAIGAGFDTLCMRLAPEFPSVSFFEMDQTATLGVKKSAVEAMGAMSHNLHFLEVDLSSEKLADRLLRADQWKCDVRSVALAEGLLMYLEEKDVSVLLQSVHRSTGPGSRLFFSYLDADEKGRCKFGLLPMLARISFKLVGERFRWCIPDRDLPGFLTGRGYRLHHSPERSDLRVRFLQPAGLDKRHLAIFDRFAIAEKCDR